MQEKVYEIQIQPQKEEITNGIELLFKLYNINRNQFFFKFKLHRDLNPFINTISQFDHLNHQIHEFCYQIHTDTSSNQKNLLLEYKEYFAEDFTKIPRLPAIKPQSGIQKLPNDTFVQFKENIVGIQFLKQISPTDCF